MSALQNVALPMILQGASRPEAEQRAQSILEKVGLGERGHHKPFELSGGQQQRVAIARALVQSPDVLLADEPTGNLDSTAAAEILGIFRDLHESGTTIVMITHNHDIAKQATRTLSLVDGVVTQL